MVAMDCYIMVAMHFYTMVAMDFYTVLAVDCYIMVAVDCYIMVARYIYLYVDQNPPWSCLFDSNSCEAHLSLKSHAWLSGFRCWILGNLSRG
jgi:hypothetical protein